MHRDVALQRPVLSYAPIATARDRVRRASRDRPARQRRYQNYFDPDLAGASRAYYGANLARFTAIKRAVDPADRFRPAQGIRPG